MSKPLLIVGASGRAAAYSAQRAGFSPYVIDCFGDADLAALCPVTQIANYPDDFLAAAQRVPRMPWIYVGGLENFPELVDQISTHHELRGTAGAALRRVRNPALLHRELRAAGFFSPRVVLHPEAVSSHQTWLEKPLRSGGGIGVRLLSTSTPAADRYAQEFVAGVPVGALFVADDNAVKLLGVTRQLIGCEWSGANDFAYCGSVGPRTISPALRSELQSLGEFLVRQFQLVGDFGVDGILQDDHFWTVEVNPRYSASYEVLERATSCPPRQYGKAVVYADRAGLITDRFAEFVQTQNADRAWPLIADVPRVGSEVVAQQPLVSVFATADTDADVERQLRQLATRVLQTLAETCQVVS